VAIAGEEVAKALAAPTRAGILDILRRRGPLSAREVSALAKIHPNVARGHLEVLASAGLVTAAWRRGATGGGRPAKVYEAVPGHVEEGPALVAEMLATLLDLVAPDPMTARKVAEGSGERLGRKVRQAEGEMPFEGQVDALLRALAQISGGVRIADRGPDWVEFEDLDCPFKPIAHTHPELACTLDKALKEGIMRGLGADAYVEQVTSIAWGDPSCREVVRLRATSQG
jgi:predicted ArsR family transcriptional regulator